jgi:hypothetical protein
MREAPDLPLQEQQQSMVERRERIGWVNRINMIQFAAPWKVFPMP